MIVPDAIEPVHGWKALVIRRGGHLDSPQQTYRWPAKERATAVCPVDNYRWELRRGKSPQQQTELVVVSLNKEVTLPDAMLLVKATEEEEEQLALPPPRVLPPAGYHWSWEQYQHEPADISCTCGIYMVDTPEQCGFYIQQDTVLVKVSGWGNVVQGDRGHRVQYAYPEELIAPERLRKNAEKASELYGVPAIIVPDTSQLPSQQNRLKALNQALNNLNATQKRAAAQIHASTQQPQIASALRNEIEPVTPFVKAAMVGLVASIVATINYFGNGRTTVGLASMLTCIFTLILCLFIDFLIFCAEDKNSRA